MAEETMASTGTQNQSTTSTEDLMAQLAEARADAERYKAANDKLSKSEAEMKRQLRASQTAEEQKRAEDEEAKKIADEEREALRKENNRFKAERAYKAISDDKAVGKLIDAVENSDHESIARVIDDLCKKAVANAEADWLKSRPGIQHGEKSDMTIDQIMAIRDPEERQRQIAQNITLFKKG